MTSQLPAKLRQARLEAGLSREKLAGELDVSYATIARLEAGRTQRISTDMVARIAELTGKPIVWFFEIAA